MVKIHEVLRDAFVRSQGSEVSGQAWPGATMRHFLDRTVMPVLALPRAVKRAIALSVDASLSILTVWVAFYLRLGEWVTLSQAGSPAVVAAVALALPTFFAFGLYRTVFRYVSSEALLTVAQAVFFYGLIYASVFTAWGIQGVPRTIGLIQPTLLLIAVGTSRVLGRYWLGGIYRRSSGQSPQKRVLIYGAGNAGRQLAAAIAQTSEFKVAGYIDDDRELHGGVINNVRIWAPETMHRLIAHLGISEIFLAIPSASRARRNEILQLIRQTGASVKTLPSLVDLAAGKVTISDVRPLDIEDLLGREAIAPDTQLLERTIRDHVVLVTGAGGSIGCELCRQIIALGPKRLLLLDSSEFALYAVHRELSRAQSIKEDGTVELLPLLASVCDEPLMRQIFSLWRPSSVYHAAAYKHVPLVEQNVVEGVRNNVLGTLVTAQLAEEFAVERFVLISTDKAVRPTSVMGTSKRVAEMILQGFAEREPGTCFTMVRFGNVLGSSGSVVPLFRQQIAGGGPVTVTHPEVTRYFMTIPEAAQLVLQASAMAHGGEVFVLDMGNAVKVLELATRMIELSGLRVRNDDQPDGDIEIVFTGMRPGEKLYEELLIGENPVATAHPRVMKATETFLSFHELVAHLERLRGALEAQDSRAVRAILHLIVPEFSPAEEMVDWAYQKQAKARAPEPSRVIPIRR
jgi:FlaA1/EpsC-like NDP-sugar epimerase